MQNDPDLKTPPRGNNMDIHYSDNHRGLFENLSASPAPHNRRFVELSPINRKILAIAAVTTLFTSFFDVLTELLIELLHSILELCHVAFELLEVNLDHLVEHAFHTGRYETQVIVFYIIMAMLSVLLYYLWRVLPKWQRRLSDKFRSYCVTQRAQWSSEWRNESVMEKIGNVALIVGLGYLASFLLF